MGNQNSGQPPSEASLTAWRAFWLEVGQNNAKTSRKFKVAEATIARYRKSREWDKWADKVSEKADEIAVVPQAKRVAKLLALCDSRIEALKGAAGDKDVPGSVAGEIERIAKTSQLLTGGVTDRFDLGGFRSWWDGLTPEQQRDEIGKLGGASG